jgi:hypothetical protein
VKTFITRYATPLTTGLFAVSTISGVALFFHWQSGAFHAMHEWLSMVLLLPFALHIWKNWRALLGYVKRKTIWMPLALSLVVAVPFAAASLSGGPGGNPAFRAVGLLTRAPIAELAPVLNTSPEALLADLRQLGYEAASAETTLSEIAAASGTEANTVLFAVMPAR